ncbi:hypothetical protein C8F01DRAFT_1260392 [Mycena amicta]|nr:hypothetical protein C8F01DRAFT_1260392 [Mycena amicta]
MASRMLALAAKDMASQSAPLPIPIVLPNLFPTWGITFIASNLSAILYGVTCIQTFLYFRNWHKDPKSVQILVIILFLLDTFHQAQIMEMMYHYLIAGFFNPLGLDILDWTITGGIAAGSATAFVVEICYVYRVWIVSQNSIILTVIGGGLTLAHLGLNISFLQVIPQQKTVQAGLTAVKSLVTSTLVVGTIDDTWLAGILVFCLWRERGRFSKTDDILRKLIAMTISTGVIVSIVSIAQLISMLASSGTLWVFAFNLLLPKLYFNSMLATLNARNTIRGSGATSVLSATNHGIEMAHGMEMAFAVNSDFTQNGQGVSDVDGGSKTMRIRMNTSTDPRNSIEMQAKQEGVYQVNAI